MRGGNNHHSNDPGTSLEPVFFECSRIKWQRLQDQVARYIYAEERLQVRRRGGRKRALETRAPLAIPQGPNRRWSLDFVSDAFTDGRRFRILMPERFHRGLQRA